MHFGILRKGLGARGIEPAARRVDAIRPGRAAGAHATRSGAATEGIGHAVGVGQDARRGVDGGHAVLFAVDGERGHHRAREGIGGRLLVAGITVGRPHAPVIPHHQHAVAAPLEAHDDALPHLGPIETGAIRLSEAGRERDLMQEVLPPLRGGDIEQRAVARFVDADTEERGVGGLCRKG